MIESLILKVIEFLIVRFGTEAWDALSNELDKLKQARIQEKNAAKVVAALETKDDKTIKSAGTDSLNGTDSK